MRSLAVPFYNSGSYGFAFLDAVSNCWVKGSKGQSWWLVDVVSGVGD